MVAFTTAAIVLCPEIPEAGLNQSMHNPSITLDVNDIYRSPGVAGSEITPQITRSLIADAIKRLHAPGVNRVFQGDDTESFPQMPRLDILKANKTQFWQFGAIYEDEGTIQGTYGVHQSIFLDQLRLQSPENPNDITAQDDFRERLWLVHGDQLTAHHIRSVKAEQSRARRPYDKRDWLLGLPAWFHIQMNLLNTIVRTHWDSPFYGKRLEAHHCIQADIIMWGRTQCSRDKAQYHLLEPVVAQGFTARVAALFYATMQRRGYVPDSFVFDGVDAVSTLIAVLTPVQFIELIEDVRVTAFTAQAWDGNVDGKPHGDIEFRTMCRFLQETELFLTVRHAVKRADIGLLQYLVDPLTVLFFGAAQRNYGYEMLHYRWNLSPVNDIALQRSILASGLVNWQGRPSTHKPIDLSLEHLNHFCKVEIKCYKNSTHDNDIIFNRICLSNTWIRSLRAKMEDWFGEDMPGTHTTANVVADMFLLASNLLKGGLAVPRNTTQLASFVGFYDSPDIMRDGMENLAKKVAIFNADRPGVVSISVPRANEDIDIEVGRELEGACLDISGMEDTHLNIAEDPTVMVQVEV
ncbi:hypothetical protein LTS18_003025 [Coniosporium uncinatum]|uniref:Uncharacterized protein n=1 Tax=Coniosporium uncinatum TaxID=93489 RepID=A0ACC3DYP2_9PEZI|nr:hypothetical protein LTS18_003025 [Coniosporium uncinatum]